MGILVIWVIFAILIWLYANKLNRNGFGYFVLTLILSPLITGVLLLALGELKTVDVMSNYYKK